MINLNTPEYDSFRQNLDYIWSDVKPETKKELRVLMYQRGFRVKKDGTRLEPKDLQLELAWEYITKKHGTVKKDTSPYSADKGYKWIKGYTYKRKNKKISVKMYRRRIK